MRAREPDAAGFVERGGFRVHWERFGEVGAPMLFLQADPIVDSRMWKAQIPWFARRHVVVTFDPRGNGQSDRPSDPSAYADHEFIADALAALDATGVERAVVLGLCQSAGIAVVLAAEHPDRVSGVVAVNPALNLAPGHTHRRPGGFDNDPVSDEGWALENRTHWLGDWARYCAFFFGEMLPEPHSSKQREDCVGWALEAGVDSMLAYCDQPPESRHDQMMAEEVCRRVRCPVLVIVGDQDMCQPPQRARAVAELTGGELLVLEGAGHIPVARDPVKVNLEIERFVTQVTALRTARKSY